MCVPSLVKIDREMPVKNPRWPPRNLVCFGISTSDRGDFPRIIVIALFVLKGALKKDIPVFWLNQKYFCQFFRQEQSILNLFYE